MMNVRKTDLAGVLLIEPDRFGDHHGFFLLKPIINDYMLGLESMPTSLGQSLTFGIRGYVAGAAFSGITSRSSQVGALRARVNF